MVGRGEYFPENCKLFPDKNDQKWVTFPNLLSKLSKKGKLFPDEYPRIIVTAQQQPQPQQQNNQSQGRIFYIICGYSSGKSFHFLLSLLNKLGKVTLFW